MSQTNTRKVARPVEGNHSTRRTRPPRPAYAAEPAPKVVGLGKVSKPVPRDKWNPGTLPQDRPGKIYDPN